MSSAAVVAALPAESIIDLGTGLADDVKALLVAALGAIVMWVIVKNVWATGGAIGATLVAILTGGLILWGAANLDTVTGWFDDQFAMPPAASRVDPPMAWSLVGDMPTPSVI